MIDAGTTLIVLAAIAGIAALLARGGGLDLFPDKPSATQLPKGTGAPMQPVGPGTQAEQPAQATAGTGATSAAAASAPSTAVYEKEPEPVLPAQGGSYCPPWTNPDSSSVPVE